MKTSFNDKLRFTKAALNKNSGPLLICLLFILLGTILIFIGIKYSVTFLYVFGGIFVGIPLSIIIYTIPSSFLYYYEQEATRKYGTYGTATIIESEIINAPDYKNFDTKKIEVDEQQYLLTYSFVHNGIANKNSFMVATKACFDALQIGTEIPIQFLITNPSKSRVRRRKLANELGTSLGNCK